MASWAPCPPSSAARQPLHRRHRRLRRSPRRRCHRRRTRSSTPWGPAPPSSTTSTNARSASPPRKPSAALPPAPTTSADSTPWTSRRLRPPTAPATAARRADPQRQPRAAGRAGAPTPNPRPTSPSGPGHDGRACSVPKRRRPAAGPVPTRARAHCVDPTAVVPDELPPVRHHGLPLPPAARGFPAGRPPRRLQTNTRASDIQ